MKILELIIASATLAVIVGILINLRQLKKELKTMSQEQESKLDQSLGDVRDVIKNGLDGVASAVAAAADRVIAALAAKDIDLSDEIAQLEELKGTVSIGVADTVAKLGQIAPSPEVEPDQAPAQTDPPAPDAEPAKNDTVDGGKTESEAPATAESALPDGEGEGE